MSPFDFVNAINSSKQDLIIDNETEKEYQSYIVNRALSYFVDTVLFANEMNRYTNLDNKMKFHFLLNSVRKRKRFSKWEKAAKLDDLELIKEFYGYNNEKAKVVLSLLNEEQINVIREKRVKGGRK
jgi:hypothetical protein